MDQNNYLFRKNHDVISAMWVVDSESSREYLINLNTNEIIAERIDEKIVDPKDK